MNKTDILQPGSHWLRALRYGALAAAVPLVSFAAGFFIGRGVLRPPKLADLGPAPHYRLTNQLGQTVSSQRFAGRVQVVTFLFPYCTTYCPLIAAHLVGFEHFLTLAQEGAQNHVEIVALNLAPSAAGPKAMRAFLKQYGWNPQDPHWQFLTGSEAQIRRVVTGGYHISYRRIADTGDDSEVVIQPGQTPQLAVANPLAEKVKPNFDVSHNDAIAIVDGKGRIRKIYDEADVVPNEQLWSDIGLLLKGE